MLSPRLLLALSLACAPACAGSIREPDPGRSDAVDGSVDDDDDDAGSAPGQADAGDAGRSTRGDGGSASDAGTTPPASSDGGVSEPPRIWQPAPGTSWQWQLSGSLDTSFDVQMYDIDLFDTPASQIAALQARGRRVVCYFDTAYEPGRPDEARLRSFRGKTIDGWPDQNWLDVRKPAVVAVMKERIALAAEKGCDGVEADDVDVAGNDTGFGISRDEQRTFIRTLASEAHALGLAYGLKNALEDVEALRDDVDFAVNEQCVAFAECDYLTPLVRAGKAVFHVEYPEDDESLARRGQDVCAQTNALGFDSLVKRLDLDAERYACR